MAYVRLPAPVPSRLNHVLCQQEWSEAERPKAGDVCFTDKRGNPPVLRMFYCCPCGCGSIGGLRVHRGGEPAQQPKREPEWAWNGDEKLPTLTPSINQIDHWHGYLTAGVFRDA